MNSPAAYSLAVSHLTQPKGNKMKNTIKILTYGALLAMAAGNVSAAKYTEYVNCAQYSKTKGYWTPDSSLRGNLATTQDPECFALKDKQEMADRRAQAASSSVSLNADGTVATELMVCCKVKQETPVILPIGDGCSGLRWEANHLIPVCPASAFTTKDGRLVQYNKKNRERALFIYDPSKNALTRLPSTGQVPSDDQIKGYFNVATGSGVALSTK